MKKRRDPIPLLLSIVVHVAVAFAILNAAFHYDFSKVLAPPTNAPKLERVTYFNLPPQGGVTGGADTTNAPARAKKPARGLVAPKTTPTTLPPVPVTGGQPGGVEGGRGRAAEAGVTTGIVPAEPDPRLSRDPHEFFPAPKTHAERVDSAVRASIYAYNDSVAKARAGAGRAPGDWTYEGKNGQKWGIDGNKIYLGKFAIPSAVLAALPIRIQGNPGETIADRLVTTRRADLLLHAESQAHDDEFKSAVKRIRERKDKERQEKKAAETDKPAATTPDLIP
jgi:hypothetical protein